MQNPVTLLGDHQCIGAFFFDTLAHTNGLKTHVACNSNRITSLTKLLPIVANVLQRKLVVQNSSQAALQLCGATAFGSALDCAASINIVHPLI